jgi:tetratricopeptide repeat protein
MFLNPREDNKELISRYQAMLEGRGGFFDTLEWEDIISYYIENMRYGEARHAADLAMETYPYSAELKLSCAEALIYDEEYAQAEEIINYLDGVMPSNPDLIVLKGIWHSMNKHPREAIELYLAAYPDYDDYFRINVLLGEEYASIENYGLAIKYFQRAVTSDPSEPNAAARLAEIYSVSQSYTLAAHFFDKLIDRNPYNADAWAYQGMFLLRMERYDEAIRALEYAILLAPDKPSPYYDMAEAYNAQEEYGKVIAVLKKLLSVKPTEDPYPYVMIGESYQCLEDFENACEYFLKAVHYDPQLARGWYGLASVHFDSGFKKQSLDYVRQGLAADAYDIECLRLAWEIEESLEMYPAALSHLQQVVNHHESTADDYLDMAYFQYQRGMLKQSLDTLKETRTLFPDVPEVFYHMGAVYYSLGDLQRSLSLFRKAISTAPELSGVVNDNYPELSSVRQIRLLLEERDPSEDEKAGR